MVISAAQIAVASEQFGQAKVYATLDAECGPNASQGAGKVRIFCNVKTYLDKLQL